MAEENAYKHFSEFQKNIAQFQLPGIDPGQWAQSYQRNLDAMNQAAQAMATGMQAYAEKQAAMIQAIMKRAQLALSESAQSGEPTEKATQQLATAKAAYDQAVQDLNEISQIMTKTNAEATKVIEKRISDSFEEIQKLLSPQKE